VQEEDLVSEAPSDERVLVVNEDSCLPTEPLLHCARRTPRAAGELPEPLIASRITCKSVGPAGCFIDRNGGPICKHGDESFLPHGSMPERLPTLACGTSGTRFLQRPPVTPAQNDVEGEDDPQAGCLTLLDGALTRCNVPEDRPSGHPDDRSSDRRMCSSACHDAVIQAIRRHDCFDLSVNSTWGSTYGGALKDHAEVVYAHCGQDLWQSAALSADSYEVCIELLVDMFRRCQEDSEKHLCSDTCAEKVDEALAAESCYGVHYYRGAPRAFRGHVNLLNELRERVCIRLPDEWEM
jgi:hypothetical protein